jgi:hypothetical protein
VSGPGYWVIDPGHRPEDGTAIWTVYDPDGDEVADFTSEREANNFVAWRSS